jgi:quercetin dioxygenase-like cupin family protein
VIELRATSEDIKALNAEGSAMAINPCKPLGFTTAALALAFALSVAAQPSAVHKTTLQDQPFPPPIYHSVTVRTEVDAGGLVAPHTHPGLETAYVVAGHALVTITGRAPQRVGAGDSFAVPPRTVHSVRNVGTGPLILVSTYVVETAQPIASPAP